VREASVLLVYDCNPARRVGSEARLIAVVGFRKACEDEALQVQCQHIREQWSQKTYHAALEPARADRVVRSSFSRLL
jgi:hypothetical protein